MAVIRRWGKRYCLSLRRTAKHKAVFRSLAEKENSVRWFFMGCVLERLGKKYTYLGWLTDILQLPCEWNADGTVKARYKDQPWRIFSIDETSLQALKDTKKCCAPVGAQVASTAGVDTQDNVTVVSGCSFVGVWLPDYYIFQAKERRTDWMAEADPRSKYICRPDGYFITQDIFTQYLDVIAQEIPGGAHKLLAAGTRTCVPLQN